MTLDPAAVQAATTDSEKSTQVTEPLEAAAAAETAVAEETAAEIAAEDAAAGVAVEETEAGVEVVVEDPAPAVVPAAGRAPGERPILTVGRRKRAIVRVRLVPGSGQFSLNGRELDNYFPNKVHQQMLKEPLVALERTEQFDVIARLHGGGVTGQAGALRLGIARALIEVNPDDRGALKRAGFLTRDARAKERKKYGLKKARKASQYSKR